MKLPESTEWLLHSVTSLSMLGPGQVASAAQLSEHYDVPAAYLAKQLQTLVRAGVLSATTGPRGGFRLARPADEISLLDIVEAVDGRSSFYVCREIRQQGRGAAPPEQCRRTCGLAAAMHDAEAAYLTAKAAVDTARLNLEYTRITAPVNGKTGAILVQPGNLVTPSASVGASALVNIVEIQPIKVSFSLPQADLPRIQARAHTPGGLTAQVQLHDAGGKDISAPVDFINNVVAATSGTIELRANFPNQDLSLVPGQLVDVVVELANLPNALVVPREAVNNGPNGQFVYVVTAQARAEERPVKLLFDDGSYDAITATDVHAGDRVITDGQLRVLPGGKVQIIRSSNRNAGDGAGASRSEG